MRYAIPTDKKVQKTDCIRLLRMVTGQQAQNMDRALRTILTLADDNHEYQSSQSYEKLYSVYQLLGLTENKSADELFPQDERNERQFKEELNKLWCVLQLQPLEKDLNLIDTYQKWQSDPKTYKRQLVQKDMEENARQMDQADNGQEQEPLPLVDQESPYYSFVSGTAYEELFNLWNKIKDDPDYKKISAQLLKQDMEQLLSEVQLHYIRRNGAGSCLPMTDNEYKKLTNLYGECVKDIARVYDSEWNILEYEQLNYLLVQNNNQLKGVSPDNLPPLANVIRGFNTPTIDFQNTHSDSVGGAMSSREAVEYIDENGELHQGFFTAEFKETTEGEDARKILEHYKEKYSAYDEHFVALFSKEENLKPFRVAAFDFKTKHIQDAMDRYIDNASWIPKEDKTNENFRTILKELAVDMEKNRNRHAVLRSSGIAPRDEVAKRSSAMSDVARTLGFPNLLVNSKRVKVKREGREIPGVMMEAAGPGTADPAYLVGTDPFYKVKPEEFSSKAMLGSLADLQILDYLCANTDRHANNFFFRQDFSDPENPKLLGVQGIDNDNSFGNLKSGGVMRLARPENLKIITPKMAAAVESMTSQELQELLKPYRFSKGQVETASVRLAQLQNMIKKGRENDKLNIEDGKLINEDGAIHIVKEDEWNRINLKSLIPLPEDKGIDPVTQRQILEIPSNIFYMASDHLIDVNMVKNGELVGEKNKNKAPIRYSKQGLEIDSEKLLKLQNEEYQKLKDIKERMDDNGGNVLKDRSKKFKAMYKAFREYTQEYQKMQQILSDTNDDNVINPEPVKGKKDIPQTMEEKLAACYRNLNAAKQKLDHEIERYRTKSHVFKIKPDNQARIDAAEELKKLIQGKRESEEFFENSLNLQERHKAKLSKNDFQLAGYIGNQIYGRMKVTLQSNLRALKANDPVHVMGVKALDAQERLWNYAQNSLESGLISVKRPDEKQRVSVEQLQKAIKNKSNDTIDMKKVRADLDTIRQYAQALNERGNEGAAELINQVEEILNPKENAKGEKTEISGRAVKAVLNKMHLGELQIAKERQKENQINPEIQHQNRGI